MPESKIIYAGMDHDAKAKLFYVDDCLVPIVITHEQWLKILDGSWR